MSIIKDTAALMQAQDLARTAAAVAHEAQPYPQDTDVFKGLAALSNAMSAAALQCLLSALSQPESSAQPEAPKGEEPPEPSA